MPFGPAMLVTHGTSRHFAMMQRFGRLSTEADIAPDLL
jgi:hypothetical protein